MPKKREEEIKDLKVEKEVIKANDNLINKSGSPEIKTE